SGPLNLTAIGCLLVRGRPRPPSAVSVGSPPSSARRPVRAPRADVRTPAAARPGSTIGRAACADWWAREPRRGQRGAPVPPTSVQQHLLRATPGGTGSRAACSSSSGQAPGPAAAAVHGQQTATGGAGGQAGSG